MEWISAKDAATLIDKSQTIISRFTKKYEKSKHIKRKGRLVFIDKDFLLSEFTPEIREIHTNKQGESESLAEEPEQKGALQETKKTNIAELKATIEFLIELQAKTENAHEDVLQEKEARLQEKDSRIADLKEQNKAYQNQTELTQTQLAELSERYKIDRHELNSIILEQSRTIEKLKALPEPKTEQNNSSIDLRFFAYLLIVGIVLILVAKFLL